MKLFSLTAVLAVFAAILHTSMATGTRAAAASNGSTINAAEDKPNRYLLELGDLHEAIDDKAVDKAVDKAADAAADRPNHRELTPGFWEEFLCMFFTCTPTGPTAAPTTAPTSWKQ